MLQLKEVVQAQSKGIDMALADGDIEAIIRSSGVGEYDPFGRTAAKLVMQVFGTHRPSRSNHALIARAHNPTRFSLAEVARCSLAIYCRCSFRKIECFPLEMRPGSAPRYIDKA